MLHARQAGRHQCSGARKKGSEREQTLRVCSTNKAAAAEARAETRTRDHVALLNHGSAAANLHIDGVAR